MKNEDWHKIFQALGLLTQVGLIMVINIGVGFLLGYIIDNLVGYRYLFKITGLLLGIGSGFYSDYRLMNNLFNGEEDKEEKE